MTWHPPLQIAAQRSARPGLRTGRRRVFCETSLAAAAAVGVDTRIDAKAPQFESRALRKLLAREALFIQTSHSARRVCSTIRLGISGSIHFIRGPWEMTE
ncbi:hypothetical protein MTO96_008651 [Rhipicephalus appendiculatus]